MIRVHLDHVSYAVTPGAFVPTLQRLGAALGASFADGGVHPGFGTRNVVLPCAGGTYIEIVSPLDHPAVDRVPFGRAVKEKADDGGGWLGWVVGVDSLEPIEQRLGRHSVEGHRILPSGERLSWQQIGVLDLLAGGGVGAFDDTRGRLVRGGQDAREFVAQELVRHLGLLLATRSARASRGRSGARGALELAPELFDLLGELRVLIAHRGHVRLHLGNLGLGGADPALGLSQHDVPVGDHLVDGRTLIPEQTPAQLLGSVVPHGVLPPLDVASRTGPTRLFDVHADESTTVRTFTCGDGSRAPGPSGASGQVRQRGVRHHSATNGAVGRVQADPRPTGPIPQTRVLSRAGP